MLLSIVTILFSVLVAYFATQNTTPVTIHFTTYTWTGVPLYLVVLASLIVGLIFAWLFQLLKSIAYSVKLKKKNKALKEERAEKLELTKKVHKLELENTKLSVKDGDKTYIEDNSL